MKLFIAAILVAILIYGFIGLAEAGVLTSIITQLKQNGIMGPGQIPLPTFMFLLAIGIIGFLGIRRKG
ncbi:hypothetical protein GWN26_14875 [Candidatus Saccharibacteria bacterium]|jgi:hypothetical protein|nr:hypothetical protein [Candidatus Saccharibacteria bacterium]